jgi:hypothetical protein
MSHHAAPLHTFKFVRAWKKKEEAGRESQWKGQGLKVGDLSRKEGQE